MKRYLEGAENVVALFYNIATTDNDCTGYSAGVRSKILRQGEKK